jgi:Viral BACON domain/Putative binding domain, N-terminal
MPRIPHVHALTLAAFVCLAVVGGAACRESAPITPSCSYSFNSATLSFGSTGGQGVATVTTGAACVWTAAADGSWVAITSGATGTGPGSVQFTVAANADTAARKASLNAGGQSLAIAQDGRAPCQFVVSPATLDVVAAGGTGSVSVTTAAGCAWTATSADPWVVVAGPAGGTGSGTASFTVAAQTGTADRQSVLTVAAQPVSVRQTGAPAPPPPPVCEYSVSPYETTLHWHGITDWPVTVTAPAGCGWTVSVDDSWLTVDRAGGSGTGVFKVSAGILATQAIRKSPAKVRWDTPSLGQNVTVTQEGCSYGGGPTEFSFASSGGTGTVNMVTQPMSPSCSEFSGGCPWTARSDVAWIHVTSSMPRSGEDPFSFTVDANTGTLRLGTITAGDLAIKVTQAAK